MHIPHDVPTGIRRQQTWGHTMDYRLAVITVHFRSDGCLIIPVCLGDEGEGALTPAQAEVLFRHTTAFPAVVAGIRTLAGEARAVDEAGHDLRESPRGTVMDSDHIIVGNRVVRCTGGRVYRW